MSEIFFIGDTHFGHANILQYEPIARPFDTVEEMNEAIIERWNKVVNKFDKVYHLGDFCFGRENLSIITRLNGQKRLILGNHDTYSHEYTGLGFLSIHGALFWNDCILTHIPVHPYSLGSRAKYNIHGHLHSKRVMTVEVPEFTRIDKRYINVSCEQNNLTPMNAEELF